MDKHQIQADGQVEIIIYHKDRISSDIYNVSDIVSDTIFVERDAPPYNKRIITCDQGKLVVSGFDKLNYRVIPIPKTPKQTEPPSLKPKTLKRTPTKSSVKSDKTSPRSVDLSPVRSTDLPGIKPLVQIDVPPSPPMVESNSNDPYTESHMKPHEKLMLPRRQMSPQKRVPKKRPKRPLKSTKPKNRVFINKTGGIMPNVNHKDLHTLKSPKDCLMIPGGYLVKLSGPTENSRIANQGNVQCYVVEKQ